MDTIELVMTVEEARRLRLILMVAVKWSVDHHGQAAGDIYHALSSLSLGHEYLAPQPYVSKN